jgi:hypothetical protein
LASPSSTSTTRAPRPIRAATCSPRSSTSSAISSNGNQVTPIAIKLDGLPHSVSRSLEGVAAAIEPGARYTLQIAGGSSVYGPVRSAGTVALRHIRLSMPWACR